ncbi:MAG: HK97 family phage prohead protease [Phycicoccus sp.]
MTETMYRSYAADELEVRGEGDGRTVIGVAVPFNRTQKIDSTLTERFMPGAFRAQLAKPWRVHFAREHVSLGGTPIGKAVRLEETDRGLVGEFRVSDTAEGRDTLTLIRDGVISELSIGFRTGPRGSRTAADGVVERTSAHLLEVSAVLRGAYGAAAGVTGVRAEEGNEAEPEREVIEIRSRLLIPPPLPAAVRLIA